MAKGSFLSTATALTGLRKEREDRDTRDQSLIFKLATHDPIAAQEMFNRRFPEFGGVTFRGAKGKFRYFSSQRGIFAINSNDPTNLIEVEGFPGQKKAPTKVPQKTTERLRLKGVAPEEQTEELVTEELMLEAQETADQKAENKFNSLKAMLAGTDAQRTKAENEILENVSLKHAFRPVFGKVRRPITAGRIAGLAGIGGVLEVAKTIKEELSPPRDTGEVRLDEKILRTALGQMFLSAELPDGVPSQRRQPLVDKAATEPVAAGGTVRVRKISTGETGKIPVEEFDPAIYEEI